VVVRMICAAVVRVCAWWWTVVFQRRSGHCELCLGKVFFNVICLCPRDGRSIPRGRVSRVEREKVKRVRHNAETGMFNPGDAQCTVRLLPIQRYDDGNGCA
jgi:hypothetical protein